MRKRCSVFGERCSGTERRTEKREGKMITGKMIREERRTGVGWKSESGWVRSR